MHRITVALICLLPTLVFAGEPLYERDANVVTINLAAAQATTNTVTEHFDDGALGIGVFFHHNRQRYWGYGFGYQYYGESEGDVSGMLEGEGAYTGKGEMEVMALEAYADLRVSLSPRWYLIFGGGVAYVGSEWKVKTDKGDYSRSETEYVPMLLIGLTRPFTSYMGLEITAKRIEADAVDISALTVGYTLKF